jgi:hypothetical protein
MTQSDDQTSNISAPPPFSRDFFKIAVWIHQTSITKLRIPSFIHPQLNKGIALVITLTRGTLTSGWWPLKISTI